MKKNYLTNFLIVSCFCVLFSCSKPESNAKKTSLKLGVWRMEMDLEKSILPFNFELFKDSMVIRNGEERISLSKFKYQGDSIIIAHPVFESEFVLEAKSSTLLEGEWINYYKGDDYKISVKAKYGESFRFSNQTNQNVKSINGKYEVLFSPEKESSKAIGIFEQEGKVINATFATETGDYRYLEGEINQDSIFLSTFDGSHAFLFEAEIKLDTIKGLFWSGTHWEEKWIAFKNSSAKLANPDSLTFIKNDSPIEFSFNSSEGNEVTYPSHDFENRVVILQIMGSWCPNCLDETMYLSELQKQYKNKGLSVLALAFERTRSEEQGMKNIQSIKQKTSADYPFLLAGYNRNTKATDVFPMLNHIMSYPTTIFIDKKGVVRKIHTGFYGPGTGEYYDSFVKETEAFIDELLAEH